MLAVTVELDWTAVALVAGGIGSIVTFFVLFDRLRRSQKYMRDQQKKDKRRLKAVAKICMLIRHDQVRIMGALEHPIEPSKVGDSGVFEALPEGFGLEELLLSDDPDEDD